MFTFILAMIKQLLNKLKFIEKERVLLYIVIYFLWGLMMHYIGQWLEIAKFTYWWQVIITYILFMVPISLLLRGYPFFTQYAYGLVAMGVLEFGGYALKTSYIYPDNILEQWFGPHTFALGMALFFAFYFPLGNLLIDKVYIIIFKKRKK